MLNNSVGSGARDDRGVPWWFPQWKRDAFSAAWSADPNLDRIGENETRTARATCPTREDYWLDMYTLAYTHISLVYVCVRCVCDIVQPRACERAADLDAGGLSRWDTAIKIHTPSEIWSLKSEQDATTTRTTTTMTTMTRIYRATGCPRSRDPISRGENSPAWRCSRTTSTLIVAGCRQSSCLHHICNFKYMFCAAFRFFWDCTLQIHIDRNSRYTLENSNTSLITIVNLLTDKLNFRYLNDLLT